MSASFEKMCDASGMTLRVVSGKKRKKVFPEFIMQARL